MICLDPRPGESLDQYLDRMLGTAKRNETPVCAVWEDRVILIRPAMTTDDVALAWSEIGISS